MDLARLRSCPSNLAHRHGNFVSISDSDRCPDLDYRATVYNGIDCSLYPFREEGGPELIFLGRIHPDKGLHLAIEVARLSGHRLLIGGIIQDKPYFEEQIRPLIDDDRVVYVGPLDGAGKEPAVWQCQSSAPYEHDSRAFWAGAGRGQLRWGACHRYGPRVLS